ncbi:MAG: hypothetical protein ACREXY_16310 [Gammaproteobacteria bacterium]
MDELFVDDQANSLRKVVSVKAPPDVAWRVFTEKMGTWWPLATYKIGKALRRSLLYRLDRVGQIAPTMERYVILLAGTLR